jgi:hypothetical protein
MYRLTIIVVLLTLALQAGAQQFLMIENFNGAAAYPPGSAGWITKNNSNPKGQGWFRGQYGIFRAMSGDSASYYAANFSSTGTVGVISNWLLTPELSLANGNVFSFCTRAPGGSQFADRLQVYLSKAGSGTDVDSTSAGVGTFSTLLLDINPTLASPGYPTAWTCYSITLNNIGSAASGRIGFRYYVINGGSAGSNSNYIGIDSVSYFGVGGMVGVQETGPRAALQIFPNPCSDELRTNGNGYLEINDLTGKLLFRKRIALNQAINLSWMQSGVYLARLFNEEGEFMASQKLLKQ